METETIRELLERKSVRVFEDREISGEDRDLIIKAACAAPTAGNQQLYTIINVTDEDEKRKLADSCDHQPFIADAKLVLVFCADTLKWFDAYAEAGCSPRRPGTGDLLLAVDDALIAAQNAVTAAWSLGIGSCYIGDIMENRKTQKEILGLPDGVFPAAMLVFGYPTDQQKERTKPPRFDERFVVCENTYKRLSGPETREMMLKNAPAEKFDEWVKAFCERKYSSDFSLEMTRSVSEFLEEYEK